MFENLNTGANEPRPAAGRLAWSSVLALAAVFLAAGCEDKGIGRPCDLRVDGGPPPTPAQGAYATIATDCPSHICIKPAVQAGVSNDLDTGAYCTVRCNSDSDCNGQTRDFSNPHDTRCKQGYTCASPFGAGNLCCAKLCYCRDFFPPSVGPLTPAACQSDSDASCK